MASLLLRLPKAQFSAAAASALAVASATVIHQSSRIDKKTKVSHQNAKEQIKTQNARFNNDEKSHHSSTRQSPTRTLESCYTLDTSLPSLGEGGFGAVHLAMNKATGEAVAVKRIHTFKSDTFQNEVKAMTRIRVFGGHKNVCALLDSFDSDGSISLVMEYISGGELYEDLAQNGTYTETDAAALMKQLASACAFLHEIGIVHADLKPENVMLDVKDPSKDATLKLVDFGSAELWREKNKSKPNLKSSSGTTAYSPPEMVRDPCKRAQPSVDMWSLGVILYIILVGQHPFGNGTDSEIAERIKSEQFPLRGSPLTEHLSENAIELIEKLMEPDPSKRMTADELLEHPLLLQISPDKSQ